MWLPFIERIHEYGTQMAGDVSRVRNPARIGRPRHVDVTRRIEVRVAVDLRRSSPAARNVQRPQSEMIVLEQDVLAIRRPRRRRIVARAGERDRAWLR